MGRSCEVLVRHSRCTTVTRRRGELLLRRAWKQPARVLLGTAGGAEETRDIIWASTARKLPALTLSVQAALPVSALLSPFQRHLDDIPQNT